MNIWGGGGKIFGGVNQRKIGLFKGFMRGNGGGEEGEFVLSFSPEGAGCSDEGILLFYVWSGNSFFDFWGEEILFRLSEWKFCF